MRHLISIASIAPTAVLLVLGHHAITATAQTSGGPYRIDSAAIAAAGGTLGGGSFLRLVMQSVLRVFVSLALALVCTGAIADGALDSSFIGGNGTTSLSTGTVILPPASFGSNYDVASAMAIQQDGKILLAGRSGAGDAGHAFVARLYPDGALDTGFGINGFFTYHSYRAGGDEARILFVDDGGSNGPTGYIYVGANLGNRIGFMRLNPSGIQDQTYGVPQADPGSTSTHLALTASDGLGTFVGYFDGSGHRQAIIGGFPTAGAASVAWQVLAVPTADRDVIPTSVIFELHSCGEFCFYGAEAIGGYADLSDIAGHNGVNCMFALFDYDSNNLQYVPQLAVFQNPSYMATGCYFDGMTEDAGGNHIAVGREFLAGSGTAWEPLWATFDSVGNVLQQGSGVGGLPSSGSNSLRNVHIQRDGKWIFSGFTGVDKSGLDGFVAARLQPLAGYDAGWDRGFGSNGISLFSIDPVDESYGYSDSQSFTSILDAYGRVIMAGDVTFSLGNDNQTTQIAIARLTDELIFASSFEQHD